MTDHGWATPSIDVTVETVIHRPVEIVASYASDPSNAPAWYAKISQVTWKTTPPVRAGSEVAFEARFLGRELAYTYEVIKYTPTSLVMRTTEGPFPMETTYRFIPTAEGFTRMTLRNRGTPQGVVQVLKGGCGAWVPAAAAKMASSS